MKKIIILLMGFVLISVGLSGCNEEKGTQDIVKKTPTISLLQTGEYVIVLAVENGPIDGFTATAVFVNQTSGVTSSGTIDFYFKGHADLLDAGDRITPPQAILDEVEGLKYTVQVIYGGDVIGTIIYTTQENIGPGGPPTVGMLQSANHISIQEVQGGPVDTGDITIIIVNINGATVTTAGPTFNDVDGDGYLSGGDTINMTSTWLNGNHDGQIPYYITIYYYNDAIGTSQFTPL